MATKRRGLRRLWASVLLVVVGGVLFAPIAAAAPDPKWANPSWATANQLDSFFAHQFEDLNWSGMAVAVITNGEVRFQKAYGEQSPGVPATVNTPFLIGSVSKQFTGLAIQQLIAQGAFGIDDSVGKVLPVFAEQNSVWERITIRQLLSHHSGLGQLTGLEGFRLWPRSSTLTDEGMRIARDGPWRTQPGTTYEYSNANYVILGVIIESLTGQKYADAISRLVLEPLGLTATTADLETSLNGDELASPYYSWFRRWTMETPARMSPISTPAAYITSTASDLTTYLQAQLGVRQGIDPAVLAAAREPLDRVDEYFQYASGLEVRPLWELNANNEGWDDPTLPTIWTHSGDATRYQSWLGFAPDLGLGVVILTNTAGGTDLGTLSAFADDTVHAILGTEAAPRQWDPILFLAPFLLMGLPLLQVVFNLWLGFGGSRTVLGLGLPLGLGALTSTAALYFAFAVIPDQAGIPLTDSALWNSAPDLALSVALSLLFTLWFALAAIRRLLGLLDTD